MAALVERWKLTATENARLRELLEDRERRLRIADGQILELNQRRQDVTKRIDDLVTQIVLLEGQLATASD